MTHKEQLILALSKLVDAAEDTLEAVEYHDEDPDIYATYELKKAIQEAKKVLSA